MDPKHKKHEQNYIKMCSNQIAQINCKEQTLKAAEKKDTLLQKDEGEGDSERWSESTQRATGVHTPHC